MFEDHDEQPVERSSSAEQQAKEKSDEFRMHAELAAVFEACRKFDAQLIPGLDAELARDVQRTLMRLDKSRDAESPILPPASADEATRLLNFFAEHELSTNNYHIHRRPGELMILRWLAGDEVDIFYDRLQAHFDAALEGYKEDERQSHQWKQDAKAEAYLKALDGIEVKMADRYLRELVKKHNLFVLSTQTADEINIAYLSDHIMGVSAEELVGRASTPPDEPSDRDLAWFFKLFSLRGMIEGVERMCFFTYLQKSDDDFE